MTPEEEDAFWEKAYKECPYYRFCHGEKVDNPVCQIGCYLEPGCMV